MCLHVDCWILIPRDTTEVLHQHSGVVRARFWHDAEPCVDAVSQNLWELQELRLLRGLQMRLFITGIRVANLSTGDRRHTSIRSPAHLS